jgi:HPt (histidine-containing phosphotransfer) domain-containing protein
VAACAPKPQLPPKNSGWDAQKFLERIGNDESLLREVTEIFLEETPKLLARLRQAIATQDTVIVERTAHSLKGKLAYFGSSAAEQARELERMGREHALEEALQRFASLEAEVSALMTAVRRNVRGDSAHAGQVSATAPNSTLLQKIPTLKIQPLQVLSDSALWLAIRLRTDHETAVIST